MRVLMVGASTRKVRTTLLIRNLLCQTRRKWSNQKLALYSKPRNPKTLARRVDCGQTWKSSQGRFPGSSASTGYEPQSCGYRGAFPFVSLRVITLCRSRSSPHNLRGIREFLLFTSATSPIENQTLQSLNPQPSTLQSLNPKPSPTTKPLNPQQLQALNDLISEVERAKARSRAR